MKIALFDIETVPNIGYVWGRYEQNVIEVIKDWHIIAFSFKWYGEKKVHTFALPDFKGYKKNKSSDLEISKKLWEMMNEADVIIAQNGDRFDIKKCNTRFLVHGLKPPAPYKTVDTLKILRRIAAFDSNKLDEVGRQLSLGRKMETGGFGLWKGCMDGDPKAWKKMKEYNKADVLLLEELYVKLRGWDIRHPDLSVREPGVQCPNCTSDNYIHRGTHFTKTQQKPSLVCKDCGRWFTGKAIKRGYRENIRGKK